MTPVVAKAAKRSESRPSISRAPAATAMAIGRPKLPSTPPLWCMSREKARMSMKTPVWTRVAFSARRQWVKARPSRARPR